jgi:ketosteroid isomerase-like protein
MKILITVLTFLLAAVTMNAQSKKEREIMGNARSLQLIVFGSKDSVQLDKLMAKTVVYAHSSGRVESREEAIRGIVNNKSVYKENGIMPYNVSERGDSMVVKHVYKATELKADGTTNELDITIETVWAKEDGKWKLCRRQATRNK